MSYEVALTSEANSIANNHLLQHYVRGVAQEDLCFALWRPSTGAIRRGALIDEIILPKDGERLLHGNASFEPEYVVRVIELAIEKNAGVAFMHSHPSAGWQAMSVPDVEAERDVIGYPAGATGLPLVGLTIGTDGYWSARFWEKRGSKMLRRWCNKTRIIGPHVYSLYFNDTLIPPPPRKEILKRTFDTWGRKAQGDIARLRVGIVGLGSVGCIVAEAMVRIGVAQLVLIDPDRIERHNLDRLLYGTTKDIGKYKVDVAALLMRRNATADKIDLATLPMSIHEETAYKSALDCDIIFSCVDRPIARDVLNYIAHAHLVPVIDGGVSVEFDTRRDSLLGAHWRAHLVTPFHQCMRCSRQYDSSMVVTELDGSLDDRSYVSNLPPESQLGNQNVFPFSLSAAATEVNLMLRYVVAPDWWPRVSQQDGQFVLGETRVIDGECQANCSFRGRRAQGDGESPSYLVATPTSPKTPHYLEIFRKWSRTLRVSGRGRSNI